MNKNNLNQNKILNLININSFIKVKGKSIKDNSFVKVLNKPKCSNIYLAEYILFIVSLILYFISLIGCFGSFDKCSSTKYIRIYFRLGFLLFISCLLFGILIVIKIILRTKKIYLLIYCSIFFIIFCFTQGTDFSHHGTYNCIIFTLFLPIFVILLLSIYSFISILFELQIKKISLIILIIFYIIFYLKARLNCSKFYDGIGEIKLQNKRDFNLCFISKPRICGKDFLSGFFDC